MCAGAGYAQYSIDRGRLSGSYGGDRFSDPKRKSLHTDTRTNLKLVVARRARTKPVCCQTAKRWTYRPCKEFTSDEGRMQNGSSENPVDGHNDQVTLVSSTTARICDARVSHYNTFADHELISNYTGECLARIARRLMKHP